MPTSVDAGVCPVCQTPYIYGNSTCLRCGVGEGLRPIHPAISALSVRTIGIALLLAASAAIAVFAYLNVRLVRSDAYKDSVKKALSSPEVQKALGNGIHVKYPVLGHLVPFEGSEFAEWSVVLAGSRGSGRLYGVANQVRGAWDFSRLTLSPENGENHVDLTPVRRLSLPQVPTKNVYLVPIGFAEGQSLDWAPAYYKSKLGIDVTVLAALPLDPKLVDSTRAQLNADKCVEFMQDKYPDLAHDPFALLIGVTSSDMYIPGFSWSFAENMRDGGRFAIISSARIHPPPLLGGLNPEWLNSRIQKLLTKNLAILYFDLPISSDYTSLLSAGVLSGTEIDRIGGTTIGAEGRWDPFVQEGEPSITIYDIPKKETLWRMVAAAPELPDTASQVFSASLGVGLFVQRKTDFIFADEPALQFSRVYRNQDDRSRAFGIGGSDSFDMFLGGQMGIAVDLIREDGARVHFVHQEPKAGQEGDIYQVTWGAGQRFANTEAVYLGDHWQIKTADGWTYLFPYRPQALPQYVTVLTSFVDPAGRRYEMERDPLGSLVKVTSFSGKWLHFENDSQHRIRKITSSSGRSVRYDYDTGGHLIRATDSDGHVDSYTYDDKGQMLTAAHGNEKPILTNEYFSDGYIKGQIMGDGRRFGYSYFRRERNVIYEGQIRDPNGLETYVQYVRGGYLQWLPASAPQ